MRERLIELLEKSGILCKDCGDYGDTYCCEAIADHLLAEGVIVPPVKVGDIVYARHWYWVKCDKGDIISYQITNISITQNKKGEWTKTYRAMEVKNGKTIDWQMNFSFDEIGKTVFLTKDEAEKALAELHKEGENEN